MDIKFKKLKTKILTIQDSAVFKRYNKAKTRNSNRNTMATLIRTDTTDNALSTLPDLDTKSNVNDKAQQYFDWKEESKQEQQEFYSLLGDRKWDIVTEADVALLVRKVAFGIYGPPTRLPNESLNTEGCDNADSNQINLNAENNNENSESNEPCQENSENSRQNENSGDDIGYTAEQMKVIKQMCTTIQEHGKYRDNPKGIRFACIFICGKTAEDKFTVPVFKTLKFVKDGVEQDVFIDTNFRVYSDWANYLKSNTLPPCDYCYPRNGTYTGSVRASENGNARNGNINDSSDDDNNEADLSEVHIEYGMSPASSKSAKVLSAVDRVATCVTWGATIVAVAGMCTVPIAGPIAAAATVGGLSSGAYVAGRSGFSLYDRKSHAQTISVKDTEARNCWLTVVGGTLGFAQARMISQLAKAAEIGKVTGIASTAGQRLFLMVNVGCISVSGLGILSTFAGLLEKKEKKELTKLDILQFSASCLFFTHSLVTFKTAQSIIKEVQNDVIDSHRQGMAGKKYRNQRNKFNKKLKKNVSESGELHGNANVVKSINNIRSTKDFYKALAEPEHPETEINLTSQLSVEEFHDASMNANEEVVPTVVSKPKPSPKKTNFNSVQNEKKAGSGTGSASKPSPGLQRDNQNVNGNKIATNIKSNTIVKSQFTIDAKTKLLILSKAQLLAKGMIDSEEFQSFMKEIYKKCEPRIKAAISKFCEVFRAAKIEEIEINGYRVFRKLSQLDMQKLAKFLVDAIQIYGPDVMMLVSMLAKLLNCNNSEEFCKCLVMTCLYVQKKFVEYEGRYQRGEIDFDFFGKPEERGQYYQKQIYSAFEGEPNQIEASLTELNNFVQEQQDEEFLHGSSSNSTSQNGIDVLEGNQVQNVLEIPSFMVTEIESSSCSNTENLEECDSQKGIQGSSCLSFCFNYNDFDSDGYGNLCEDQYLQIVSEMLNIPLRGDTIFEYAGDITFMYFSSPFEDAAYGVKIEKVGEQDNYFGIVTILNE